MAGKRQAGKASRRKIPILIKGLILCAIAVVVLLIMLPAPPDMSSGGVTKISKHVPPLRDTVDPPGQERPARVVAPAPVEPSTPELQPVEPSAAPQPVVIPKAVEPAPQEPPVTAALPEGPQPPVPGRKPGPPEPQGPPAPLATLPWETPSEVARLPSQSTPDLPPPTQDSAPPSSSEISGWVRSQAWEFLGGVDAQGNILYRFEVWLEAPPGKLDGVKSVSYEYDAPSATPKTRETSEAKSGFRARFGSLACAKEITIVLTMKDGSKQKAVADGCRTLN